MLSGVIICNLTVLTFTEPVQCNPSCILSPDFSAWEKSEIEYALLLPYICTLSFEKTTWKIQWGINLNSPKSESELTWAAAEFGRCFVTLCLSFQQHSACMKYWRSLCVFIHLFSTYRSLLGQLSLDWGLLHHLFYRNLQVNAASLRCRDRMASSNIHIYTCMYLFIHV